MTTQEQKQSKYAKGFTPRISEDLKILVLKIQAKRIVEEETTISINQVVSDLVRAGIEKCYPTLAK
jgi:hypothetical protein